MQTLTVSNKPVPRYIPWELSATKEDEAPVTLKGLAASPGVAEGPCTIIRSLEDLRRVNGGTILVCEIPLPALAPYMPYLRGLVAGRGGPGCIAAGYAREYGIPAVVGMEAVMNALHTGDVIRIDGSRGSVEIIG